MGCYIHTCVQVRESGNWKTVDIEPIWEQMYGGFGWLAGVRNYSAVDPLIPEPRGFPDDFKPSEHFEEWEDWEPDAHSRSWVSAAELAAVDYDQIVEDRRCEVQTGPNSYNGGATCEPGQGKKMPLREFLRWNSWMKDIEKIIALGDARVVFWFDN